jgi:hypothetical protein
MLSFTYSFRKFCAALQKKCGFVGTGASLSRMIVTYDEWEKACADTAASTTLLELYRPGPFSESVSVGEATSFWKAGSPRNGSQTGSSLRRAPVMGVGL